MLEPVAAQQATGIVISEFRFRGPSALPATDPGSNDEYVELYNAGSQPVNVNLWTLWASNNNSPPALARRATLPNFTIEPGCFLLYVNNNAAGPYTGPVSGDLTYAIGFADAGGIALFNSANAIVDQVGLGTQAAAFGEGNRLPPLNNVNNSYERKPGSAAGHGTDTNDNRNDFQVITPANPQNRSQQFCIKSKVYLTHEVQGSGRLSTMVGQLVTVRGVVTARSTNGFFLQTADSDQEDGNPMTSEGLFVAHVSPAAQLGRVLHVTGTVAELDPANPNWGPVTHLRSVTNVADVAGSAVPAPYQLTSAELNPDGLPDQLEFFEGMLVTASLRSISGTSLDGSFYTVLADAARPFREPGIEVGSPVLPCAGGPCAFERFDGNPERLRVDSDGLEGRSAVNLSTGATMDITGPLDYAMRAFTVLPETLAPSGGMMMTAAPAPGAGQFSIASLNLGDAGVMAQDTRLAKAALMVQTMFSQPEIVAVQGAEDAAVLVQLAERLAGYSAHLDSFLVKSSRVTVMSVEPTYQAPGDGSAPLFDKSPVMLRAVVNGGALVLPQHVTVLNNQLRSLADVGRNDAVGQQARAQRDAQAEWLAEFVQDRQLSDPNEAIVSLGNFNAHEFNDGYVDMIGTVMGSPAPADQVVLASPDLVSPDLLYLGGGYSSVLNGNAQSLDHMVATANLAPQFIGVAYARVNADFPEALRVLPDNPGRLSDRDPSVANFSFPPDVDAPVISGMSNQEAEATGPNGAVVVFPIPAATDNLDQAVNVTCDWESGSTFPVGNTGVTCSAQDAAGNPAAVSFTVSVVDTTAPALTVPADIVLEAVSPSGRVITFETSATDSVSGAVTVSCSPASGSVFPIDSTDVMCVAQDAKGNTADASFTVTVQDTTGPVLTVPSDINEEASSADGRVITFATSAIDAVSGSVGVSCVPASGSTFPIGTTAVDCTALDAASNVGEAHFSVTVRRPVPGRIHGGGTVQAGAQRLAFTFEVGESDNFVERGWLMVLSSEGKGRPRHFTARASDVTFSDAEGYQPGSSTTNVDTVTFTGVGSWNGLPNHSFTVTASDRGEPGVGLDTFSLVVKSPAGQVVESISGVLRGGNIQSLRH
jgi:hypothetical protein